eukprot:7437678-Pyramimonas_sp.AAC.1
MRTLAMGRIDFASIRQALLQMDVTEKKVLPSAPPPLVRTYWEGEAPDVQEVFYDDDLGGEV